MKHLKTAGQFLRNQLVKHRDYLWMPIAGSWSMLGGALFAAVKLPGVGPVSVIALGLWLVANMAATIALEASYARSRQMALASAQSR